MSRAIQTALRHTRRRERLGSQPCCAVCGESNPARLVRCKGHHPTGQQRDPEFATLVCGSCHQEAHARLADAGIGMVREGSTKACTATRLRAMAVFRRMEADHLERWADELENSPDQEKAKR